MKRQIIACVAAALLAAALVSGCGGGAAVSPGADAADGGAADYVPQLAISEYMPKNHSTLADDQGAFPDWVEIENISGSAVELDGWYLSDRRDEARWSFGGMSLAPGELLLVFLGGDGSLPLHTGFGLSAGETLYLCDASGGVSASVLCADGSADTAYTLNADGTFSPARYATPGYPNTARGYDDFCAAQTVASPLIINEVMVSNLSYYSPYPTVTCDWVELKNVSDSELMLSDYYLSDDNSDYLLWQLPALSLAPGECLAFYCSGDTAGSSGRVVHTSFSLNALNEELFLSDASGAVADYVHLHDIPTDYSMGRVSGENGFFYFSAPTLNGDNSGGLRRVSATPSALSVDGVYNGVTGETVELTGSGAIYYTTDGSVPTAASAVYSGPIDISETTVVRAVSIEDGAYPSRPLTLSYIINENHTLPVLSLVVDDQTKFDAMFDAGQKDIDLQANLALYEDGGGFSSPCSVTMKGWTSLTMYKKSLGVSFKGLYGAEDLNYDVFGNGISCYSSLSIRAGQDYNRAIFRDELFQELCLETGSSVLTQESKYCILYVNGRYWGIYALKEDFSKQYYASHTGVSRDSVEIQTAPARRSSNFFSGLVTYSWVSDPLSDEYYQTMDERMDIDSLIDWFILEGYSANVDVRGNVRYFRSPENGNKWQFAFYDLDWAFYNPGSCYVNIFEELGNAGNEMPTLVKTMLQNPTFRDRFITRYAQLISSTLSNEHVLAKIDEYQALLEPEAARDRERWELPLSDWYTFVDELRAFITDNDLENKTTEILRDYLDISDEEMIKYFG